MQEKSIIFVHRRETVNGDLIDDLVIVKAPSGKLFTPYVSQMFLFSNAPKIQALFFNDDHSDVMKVSPEEWERFDIDRHLSLMPEECQDWYIKYFI